MVAGAGKQGLTSDQELSPAVAGVMQVLAGADVDTGIGGLHAREVKLRAWGGETLVRAQLHMAQ